MFEDEAGPATDALLERLFIAGAAVPDIWPLEVANLLFMAQRRNRMDAARRREMAAFLASLPIHVMNIAPATVLRDVLALAHRERLTAHDAAYLHLAMQLAAPLATLDRDLRQAARRHGVCAARRGMNLVDVAVARALFGPGGKRPSSGEVCSRFRNISEKGFNSFRKHSGRGCKPRLVTYRVQRRAAGDGDCHLSRRFFGRPFSHRSKSSALSMATRAMPRPSAAAPRTWQYRCGEVEPGWQGRN